MKEKDHKNERRVLQDLVIQSKDNLRNILEYFKDSLEHCSDSAYDEAIEDIFLVMMKIIRRATRFVEYRSKIRILQRGEKISEKELERCDFVVKFNHKNQVKIIKNNFSDTSGRFNRVQTFPK